MNIWSVNCRPAKRFPAAGIDWDIYSTNSFEDSQSVGRRILERGIAVDGCNP
jgi:hypothetical protein